MNRAHLLSLLILSCFTMSASAENPPPEVVRIVDNAAVVGNTKSVTMESDSGHYLLLCNVRASGCITPLPQGRYYLITNTTLWQIPGAKRPIDLKFVQDWTSNYPNIENVGLVPKDPESPVCSQVTSGEFFGLFMLINSEKR
jgi:hypothetical protein